MSKENPDWRDASRREFYYQGVHENVESIKIGALQRIADALEKLAANHDHLVADRDYWRQEAEIERDLGKREIRRNRSLRGVITRLRAQ